jgi:carboxylate-amine ligase
MPIPDRAALQRAFDQPTPCTVGLEEEVFLLDPVTLDLLPCAAEVIATAGLVKPELPASQLELNTAPATTVTIAVGELARARRSLADAASPIGRLAAIGVHPFAAAEGELTVDPRYKPVIREYGWVARRQLVGALQVHVAIRPAARAIAVYNTLRSYLPEIAAFAANSPFYCGQDTGFASIRPKLSETLPRQGIPPILPTVDAYADELQWAQRAGAIEGVGQWWWELRMHPGYGTLEVRVADAQSRIEDVARVAALTHSLSHWLAERHDAGDLPPPAPTWRIEQNRWSACRHGIDGTIADLETGRRISTRQRLDELVEEIMPTAATLGCAADLRSVRDRLAGPATSDRYRQIGAAVGLVGLVDELATEFCAAGQPAMAGGIAP